MWTAKAYIRYCGSRYTGKKKQTVQCVTQVLRKSRIEDQTNLVTTVTSVIVPGSDSPIKRRDPTHQLGYISLGNADLLGPRQQLVDGVLVVLGAQAGPGRPHDVRGAGGLPQGRTRAGTQLLY